MVCWYCHWGWPKQVADIYDSYDRGQGILEWGRSHVVWGDENFDDDCIKASMEGAIDPNDIDDQDRYDSLEELLTIPESIRCPRPDYWESDDDNVEDFPPPEGMVMVKK